MVSSGARRHRRAWALVIALSPVLQMREIARRQSSEGISMSYFAVLLIGFGL